jgi:hypothetical protein
MLASLLRELDAAPRVADRRSRAIAMRPPSVPTRPDCSDRCVVLQTLEKLLT